MASMDEDSGSYHHKASIQSLEEEEEQQHSSDLAFSEQRKRWEDEQDELKLQLVLFDDFPWMIPPSPSEPLRYIAGVDISFWKKDPCVACAAIVVIDMRNNMSVIYQDYEILTLTIPYIPGFLAFRECPVLLRLLKKLHETELGIYPQLLMVDGNGILHPRGFGLACHLGVLADIPTIGVAKNLHHVDGLCKKELHIGSEGESGCVGVLKGRSGQILGMALRSHAKCKNPIFVSVGHRASLQTAVELVQLCCKYRVPEPVRQADIKSREKLRITFDK